MLVGFQSVSCEASFIVWLERQTHYKVWHTADKPCLIVCRLWVTNGLLFKLQTNLRTFDFFVNCYNFKTIFKATFKLLRKTLDYCVRTEMWHCCLLGQTYRRSELVSMATPRHPARYNLHPWPWSVRLHISLPQQILHHFNVFPESCSVCI